MHRTGYLDLIPNLTFPSTRDWLIYTLTFAPPLLLLAVVGLQQVVPIAYLVKDPLAVAELTKGDCCHVYYGLVSNIGIIFWCTAAAICIFTALTLALAPKNTEQSNIIFLIAAGAFTGWLMLDDFFLVHEDVFPALGVSQPVTYAFYAFLAVLYFSLSWRKILTHRPFLLAIALMFLGSSVVIDVVLHSESTFHMLAEDGAKILGISAWCAFHIDAALEILQQNLVHHEGHKKSSRRRNIRIVASPTIAAE